MNKIELLAPAGNFDCLMAAVQNGADAVYLSGKRFGARSFANNFDFDELKAAVEYCHLRNVDVHVTVNTIVSDRELAEFEDYIRFLTEINVDAVIVQDIGAFSLIKRISPDLSLHASTQMTIHNLEGVLALQRLGASRVVLSRELSIKEIEHIVKNCDVEIEVFGHGAICMSYSGQCLMSSMLGGRSGNRGKCAQPCRLRYSVNGLKDTKTYLSPKDMISLPHLSELERIGVSSLKIEGRMKGIAYVAAVVDIYRKYLDNFCKIEEKDLNTLNEVFYRGGLTDGYFVDNKGVDMFELDKPDNPYQKNSKETIKRYEKDYSKIERAIYKVDVSIKIKTGEKPELVMETDDITVKVYGNVPIEKAAKLPIHSDTVHKQLSKLGGTVFQIDEFKTDISRDAFISAKYLNELRRNAVDELTKKIIERYNKKPRRLNSVKLNTERDMGSERIRYTCSVLSLEQFETASKYDFYKFYVPINLLLENTEYFDSKKDKIIISLPAIIKNFENITDKLEILRKIGYDEVKIDNISELFLADKFKLNGGFRLNIFNSISMDFYSENIDGIIALSPEMNLPQIRDLRKHGKAEVNVYGRVPLMITENCIIKNAKQCPCNGENYINDRKGMSFPVVKDCGECRNVVLNSLPLFMGDKMAEVKRCGVNFANISFTVENGADTRDVCEMFFENKTVKKDFEYTRSYFNKKSLE